MTPFPSNYFSNYLYILVFLFKYGDMWFKSIVNESVIDLYPLLAKTKIVYSILRSLGSGIPVNLRDPWLKISHFRASKEILVYFVSFNFNILGTEYIKEAPSFDIKVSSANWKSIFLPNGAFYTEFLY